MTTREVGVVDTTLRSLVVVDPVIHATVGRLAPVLHALDRAGFAAIDAWGELTVEHALAAFNESPWERLRGLSTHLEKTPIVMTIRGASLVEARPFGMKVVGEFLKRAADCGVSSFQVLDPVNDPGRLEAIAGAVRDAGAGLRLAVVYAAGSADPVRDTMTLAERAVAMEPDAICLKTASAVGPTTAVGLVRGLRGLGTVPIEVDLDNAAGIASVTAALCAKAGADVVYASCAPCALDPTVVSVTALLTALSDIGAEVGVDDESVAAAGSAVASLLGSRDTAASLANELGRVDRRLASEMPVGLLMQLARRLQEQGALERLPEVAAEIERVRQEIGAPSLVGPIGHIAATQAALNVLYGRRWTVVPDEMKTYLRGGYGSLPAGPAAEVSAAVLDHEEPDESSSASGRREQWGEDLLDDAGDSPLRREEALIAILAPGAIGRFRDLRTVGRRVDGSGDSLASSTDAAPWEDEWEDLGPERIRELVALLEQSSVDELTIENKGTRVSLRKAGSAGNDAVSSPAGAGASRGPGPEASVEQAPGTSGTSEGFPGLSVSETQRVVVASMVGTFYRGQSPEAPPYVEEGAHVESGDVLCVLEAMKLMNEVVAEVSGTVSAVLIEDGGAVEYGQPLFLIETADA